MTPEEKKAADEAAKVAKAAPKGTQVKFIKSHQAYGYHVDETGELPADKATALVKSGHCQAVAPQTDEQR